MVEGNVVHVICEPCLKAEKLSAPEGIWPWGDRPTYCCFCGSEMTHGTWTRAVPSKACKHAPATEEV